MHFSLMTAIGNKEITTTLLTGKPVAILDALPSHSETDDISGEYYNEYEEEGECSEYFLSIREDESLIITECDIESDECYVQVVVNYPELTAVVEDKRLRKTYEMLLEHLEQFECPQHEDLEVVRAIINMQLG